MTQRCHWASSPRRGSSRPPRGIPPHTTFSQPTSGRPIARRLTDRRCAEAPRPEEPPARNQIAAYLCSEARGVAGVARGTSHSTCPGRAVAFDTCQFANGETDPDAPGGLPMFHRLFGAVAAALLVVALGASTVLAGEVKGPPGTINNTNRTGALAHANSACAASGLN